MHLLNIQPRKPKTAANTVLQARKKGPSPSENPFLKDLAMLERLSHRRCLQRPKPGVPQNSLLLSLPPELRNTIYTLVLVSEEPILVDPNTDTTETGDRYEPDNVVIMEPALLRTCRSTRSEASQLYYSNNVFCSINYSKLFRWIEGIGVEKRALLRDIRTSCRLGMFWNDSTPYLLLDLEWMETKLAAQGIPVGNDVCRTYMMLEGPHSALTRSETCARMSDEQWRMYHQLGKVELSRRTIGQASRG